MALPDVLRVRDFNLYWSGVVLSQIGTRGTVAANLFQVYDLTGSIAQTGLVGAAQAVALLGLSPLGGALADRYDRRRLLQAAQAVSLVVAAVLAVTTFTDRVQAWQVLASVVFTTAAASFDQPARQSLIPALVPRHQIAQAIALLNPSRELAVLMGPLLAGILIAISGPGLMYAVDAGTYGVLIVVLAFIRTPRTGSKATETSLLATIIEGAVYVRRRPLIYSLMALDLSATVFGAYRVLLPALSAEVLDVGPAGYGVLSSAPAGGALLATYSVFRTVGRSNRQGKVLLGATALYGLSAVLLAHSAVFVLAVVVAGLLGAFDAMATTIRHAAVQIDTPDEIRGRVSATYQMASRGGPAIGDVLIGTAAGAVGATAALTVGGAIPVLVAAAFWRRSRLVRDYKGRVGDEPIPPPLARTSADSERSSLAE